MKPSLSVLSQKEIQRLHDHALILLSEVGIKMPHSECLDLLAQNGADIRKNHIVKMPAKLIQNALESVPKRDAVTLFAREASRDVQFKSHQPALACMTMAVNVMDPDTRKKRPANVTDLENLTRLADQLPSIAVNGGLVTPQEVPGEFNDWYTWAITLKQTTKHITGGMYGAECVKDAMAMASALVGRDQFLKRPFISGWILTLPPLGVSTDTLDALMEMSRWNIPSIISSGPILGTSSPVTIAGTIAQAHAEILACIVISQLVNAGSPMIYTSFARGVDMMTGNISMACPEFGILKVAMAQMGRYLDLPVRMPAMLRDAKLMDAQAGFETGMIGTMGGLTSDLLDAMQLDMDMVVDYPDLVFCDDCMAAVQRVARELDVSDPALAMDVIKAVGPGGNFLAHPHTLQHFKTELWRPRILERRNWETWEKEGALNIFQKAEALTRQLLKDSTQPLVSETQSREIDAILERAQAR